MTENTEEEMNVEVDEEQLAEEEPSIALEVNISPHHKGIYDSLEEMGVDMDENLAMSLQPQVETTIHEMLQQARYQQ